METKLLNPSDVRAEIIVLPVFEDKKEMSDVQKVLNEKFSNIIEENILKTFDPKLNETLVFPLPSGTKIVALGLGKYEELTLDKYRHAIAKAYGAISGLIKGESVAFELIAHNTIEEKCLTGSLSVVLGMNNYKFDKYTQQKGNKIKTLEILTLSENPLILEGAKIADILSNSMNYTRDLIFESAEIATPSYISECALQLANNNNLEIKVYNKEELKKMNFNAFLAVGQGSAQEPKFIHLSYKPKNPRKKIALIGKGITFDSGGLDIKPASSMLTMKTDMSGCATVLGVMKAISEIKPDVELHILSALCENMPSGTSYKVGDVLVSKSGKTIEVDNTDAEGRLTLADALTYADELNVDEVIDIATLTGAVIVALGDNITGIMGNNQEQIDEFKKVASKTGERVWQLPIYDDMKENLKSDIADMKNTGSRYAGSSVAGWFLRNFTKSKKWLHIDIAGTAYTDKAHRETPKGATGVMLRTLVQYIIS